MFWVHIIWNMHWRKSMICMFMCHIEPKKANNFFLPIWHFSGKIHFFYQDSIIDITITKNSILADILRFSKFFGIFFGFFGFFWHFWGFFWDIFSLSQHIWAPVVISFQTRYYMTYFVPYHSKYANICYFCVDLAAILKKSNGTTIRAHFSKKNLPNSNSARNLAIKKGCPESSTPICPTLHNVHILKYASSYFEIWQKKLLWCT